MVVVVLVGTGVASSEGLGLLVLFVLFVHFVNVFMCLLLSIGVLLIMPIVDVYFIEFYRNHFDK